MATALSSILSQTRTQLLESSASFWSDAELVLHINNGIKDLWGAIIDLHQEHFMTVDASNVSLAASGTSLTGVPATVFRVLEITPRDLTSSGTYRNIVFKPLDYNHVEFQQARSQSAQAASGGLIIYYAVATAGGPVAAPTIYTAPLIDATVTLRLVYIQSLSDLTTSDNNPIPGHSDMALIAYAVAYARAKERDDRMPDPNWLAIYATEKQNLLTRLTPRQEQEPEVVEDFFRQD